MTPALKTIITHPPHHVKHHSKKTCKISKRYFCNARLIKTFFVFVFVDRFKIRGILIADERDSKQPTGEDDDEEDDKVRSLKKQPRPRWH